MSNQITNFTPDQVALIKTQVAPEATTDELKLFLHACSRYGLDPLQRQIFCIHRTSQGKKKMTIQTSIDGFRIIAERTGEYAGQDRPTLFYDSQGNLEGAEVTVYRFRNDIRYAAAVGVAYFAEYLQTDYNGKPMGLWNKMPRTMVTKCAEALALRKAFPQQLSGLYTDDEMTNAATQPAQPEQKPQEQTPAPQIPAQTTAAPIPIDKIQQPKKVDKKPAEKTADALAETVPATVAGKWYVRLDKCKTQEDVQALGVQYEDELAATPELKKVFREYYNKLKVVKNGN